MSQSERVQWPETRQTILKHFHHLNVPYDMRRSFMETISLAARVVAYVSLDFNIREEKKRLVLHNWPRVCTRTAFRFLWRGSEVSKYAELQKMAQWSQTLKIGMLVMRNLLTRSLVRSHRSLLRLLRTTHFARALRCAHLFAHSLTSLTPSLVGQWMIGWLFILRFFYSGI